MHLCLCTTVAEMLVLAPLAEVKIAEKTLCAEMTAPATNGPFEVNCGGMMGRYVLVTLPGGEGRIHGVNTCIYHVHTMCIPCI